MYKKILSVLSVLLCVLFALSACNRIGEGEIPGAVEKNGIVYAPLNEEGSEYELVSFNSKAEELVIPSEINGKPVKSIGNSAFSCSAVRKVTVPDGVVKIDNYAFESCTSLESIILPDTVETIGFNAFSDCSSLREFRFPASLKSLGINSFSRCTSLEKIYVNSALERIENDSFLRCESLSEIYVEDISAWCRIDFENIEANPLSIAEKLYVSDNLVEELVIENVETVSDYAFFRFSGIKKLTLGEGVRIIGESAFSNCTSLTHLTLSDSVATVGKSAFNSCQSLEYVFVGKGIQRFEGLAFYACSSIYAVEISDLSVWCEAFFYTDNSGTANPMRYADTLIVDGKEVDELVIPKGVKKISTLAFIGFNGTKIVLPSTLKRIEDTAFYMCENLTRVHFDGTRADLELLLSATGANNFNKGTPISYNR